MLTLNKHKIHSKLNFLIFFLSLAVLAGCKPSIDYLEFVVTKAGEKTGEGVEKSIDGDNITLEPISPGDTLGLVVETGDGQSSHIENHTFRWEVLEGDIGEWQINGTEAGDLGEKFWDTYRSKAIKLTAPDGANSQITLRVTVTCEIKKGDYTTTRGDYTTTLDIKISSKWSKKEEVDRRILRVQEIINEIWDEKNRSIKKAGDRKSHIYAEVIQSATNDYLSEKEPDLEKAEAKLHYVRTLEEKTQKNTYLQDMTNIIDSADGIQSCVSSFPKDFAHRDHKYTHEEKHHNAICGPVIKLKESMNEKCILEVVDRGADDPIVISCNNDEDDSFRQNFSNKAGDSRGEFVPELRQEKYFVTYRLTEGETYGLYGNAKDLPRLLHYNSLAKVYCEPINPEQYCVKKIPQDQIAGLRLMLSQLYERKHPMMCGGKGKGKGKTNQDCEKQISLMTQLGKHGKRDRPSDENTINQQDGNKRQKTNSDAESIIKTQQNLKDDINPDDYCRTVSFDSNDSLFIDDEHENSSDYLPVYPKESEKEFVQKAKDQGKVVICFSAEFADTQNLAEFKSGEWGNDLSYAIDCDAYNQSKSVIPGRICNYKYDEGSIITLFVALPSNGGKPEFSFKNYYSSNKLIISHTEQLPLGNVKAVTIKDRSSMFNGATNLEYVYIDTYDTENMSYMFAGAKKFNFDKISDWDTGNVTDMSGMFSAFLDGEMDQIYDGEPENQVLPENSSLFSVNINNWDVSKVIYMNEMFYGAHNFDQPLDSWKTPNLTYMSRMFMFATKFTGKGINNFTTDKVEDMNEVFMFAENFNADINMWETKNVTNMSYMFYDAKEFEGGGIGSWNVEKVENMSHMFDGASKFNLPSIGEWKPRALEKMVAMFKDAIAFNQDISTWNNIVPNQELGNYDYVGIYQNCGITRQNEFNTPFMEQNEQSGSMKYFMFEGF